MGQILTKKKTKNNTITEKNVFLRQYIKLVSKQVMLTLSLPFILCVYLCVILSNVWITQLINAKIVNEHQNVLIDLFPMVFFI